MSKLAELKAALEAATPGPWITAADPSHYDSRSEIYRVEDGEFVAATGGKWDTLEANAHLIASAPEWLAKLIAVAEATEDAAFYLETGFMRCPSCGHQIDGVAREWDADDSEGLQGFGGGVVVGGLVVGVAAELGWGL